MHRYTETFTIPHLKKKIPSNNFMPDIRTHKVVPPRNDASFSNTGKEAAFSLFSMLGSFSGSREPAPEDQGQQEEGKGKFVTKDDPYVYKVSHHMKLKKKKGNTSLLYFWLQGSSFPYAHAIFLHRSGLVKRNTRPSVKLRTGVAQEILLS